MAADSLLNALANLTPSQRDWVEAVIAQFKLPATQTRNPASDVVTEAVLARLSDALRIHHAFSRQPLSKDRFEYALERALNLAQIPAQLVDSRTHPGHDITINGVRVGLKSEAAVNTKVDTLHVSKWMELGKGEWKLDLLRDRFLAHIANYDRVFTLRCLQRGPVRYTYELVEIPKDLLQMAKDARLEIMVGSTQNPKPGYGYVTDAKKREIYSLYFDGGTERKLQIKNLSKADCVVHATWTFESAAL